MRPEERDPANLWDMHDVAVSIIGMTRDVALEEYLRDRKLQLAIERSLEILGEAARRISASLQAAHPEIPWAKIIAQRNVLAHEYGDIEQDRIWRLVVERIPELVTRLAPLIPPLPPTDV